jgi:hypothetical protein
MCWLDKTAIEQILALRDDFSISTFVETGTFRGVNANFHSRNFDAVLTCDISDEYLRCAKQRLDQARNVMVTKQSSPEFLELFAQRYQSERRSDIVFIYLDAHFYDPSLPANEKWVVLSELKALKGFNNCVICIHDFDCEGLGHCCYDNEPLGWPLIRDSVTQVNQNFHYYTNTREFCNIYTEETIKNVRGITLDDDTLDNIRYARSAERLTYQGILYCTPQPLDLTRFKLKPLNPAERSC